MILLQVHSKCPLEEEKECKWPYLLMMVMNLNRGMDVSQSRSHTPDPLSPDRQQQQQVPSPAPRGPGPSPTMQQRIKAIGVQTPLAMSSPVRRSVSTQCSGAGVYNNLACSVLNFFPLAFFLSILLPFLDCPPYIVFRLMTWNYSVWSYSFSIYRWWFSVFTSLFLQLGDSFYAILYQRHMLKCLATSNEIASLKKKICTYLWFDDKCLKYFAALDKAL
jgi:hypothetical protein